MERSVTVIAIDGPGGAGKSTLASALARRLGLRHVDTGAYYRAAALAVLRAQLDPGDPAVADHVAEVRIERRGGRTLLDGVDVEDEIRGSAVTAAVSAVARHPRVRELLVARQREEVGEHGAVVEGRDAGTVVVPDADLKVWLTASPRERAVRRAAQSGLPPAAVEAQVVDLVRRDTLDAAQMGRAADAVLLDTTDRTVDALVDEVVAALDGVRT